MYSKDSSFDNRIEFNNNKQIKSDHIFKMM